MIEYEKIYEVVKLVEEVEIFFKEFKVEMLLKFIILGRIKDLVGILIGMFLLVVCYEYILDI